MWKKRTDVSSVLALVKIVVASQHKKRQRKKIFVKICLQLKTPTRTWKLVHALHYANELLLRVRFAFQNLLQTRQTSRNYQNRFWLWLSIVWETHKLLLYQPGVTNFSLQNTRKRLHVSASRYYSFTARNERNFRPWKLTLSLTRSIKVHRRALVPYSLPSLWKILKRI